MWQPSVHLLCSRISVSQGTFIPSLGRSHTDRLSKAVLVTCHCVTHFSKPSGSWEIYYPSSCGQMGSSHSGCHRLWSRCQPGPGPHLKARLGTEPGPGSLSWLLAGLGSSHPRRPLSLASWASPRGSWLRQSQQDGCQSHTADFGNDSLSLLREKQVTGQPILERG